MNPKLESLLSGRPHDLRRYILKNPESVLDISDTLRRDIWICLLFEKNLSESDLDNKKARIKYINTKAPPPFCAALVGKPQILPRPTAEPDAAKINAKREEN